MTDQVSGPFVLEVIACSAEDARNAATGGAHRLEVIRSPECDGLTPSIELVKRIRDAVPIPLHAMIRPRNVFSGFSAREIDSMLEAVHAFRRVGVDGIVVGFLTQDGDIDFETLDLVAEEARGISITFHRAFDHARDLREALRELLARNIARRILTSGGASSAWEGKDVLADLALRADGRIGLMAGGGVTAENLPLLARHTGLREFHAGRGVRTPPVHEGIVDTMKVLHLAAVARSAFDTGLTSEGQ